MTSLSLVLLLWWGDPLDLALMVSQEAFILSLSATKHFLRTGVWTRQESTEAAVTPRKDRRVHPRESCMEIKLKVSRLEWFLDLWKGQSLQNSVYVCGDSAK